MGPLALVAWLISSQAPSAPPIVTSVNLLFPEGADAQLKKEAIELVAIHEGQELSARAVRRTIQRLMGSGRFADVVVLGEERKGGIELVIVASPKRKVGEVSVDKKTSALSDGEVKAASKLEQGSEYSPEAM